MTRPSVYFKSPAFTPQELALRHSQSKLDWGAQRSRVASPNDKTLAISLFQDVARDHSAGGVMSFSTKNSDSISNL
jgi:hypothetical protein